MKRRLVRSLEGTGRNLVIGWCVAAQVAFGFGTKPSAIAAAPPGRDVAAPPAASPAPSVKVNRTVPKVEPPRIGLNFSANPTVDEFFRARVFAEPLVPVGGEPTATENAALASALLGYAKRSGPDDFSSLTAFLATHPKSPWNAALLTGLGREYHNTAHYSLALDAWEKGWSLAKHATDPKGKPIGDAAAGELAYMYARLGRMTELDTLLNELKDRVFVGPATEKMMSARTGLDVMKNRPEIAFRCGPLALHQIKLSLCPTNAATETAIIHESTSTQQGCSLPQVAALSKKIGLDYQMAFREKGADFIMPSVVHWKVGHYAAMIRAEGDRYLLEDATFRNRTWATRAALEAEASGYFLVPPGPLAGGWRAVAAGEGERVWGKGYVLGSCGDCGCPSSSSTRSAGSGDDDDEDKPSSLCDSCPIGLAVASVPFAKVSLQITDSPVGYSPPVGPSVQFLVRYDQRDASQPGTFTYANFGPKWSCGWIGYITDNPQNPAADVSYYATSGGTRTFTGYNPSSQTYAYQLYDQTLLARTASPISYEMRSRNGWRKLFSNSDGSAGTSRRVFLTQIIDPSGNTLTLTYDANLRIAAITDAIGQVTTLTYGNTNDIYKITKVTDPFGRFAIFDYDVSNRLVKITDVIGLTSQFAYDSGDFITGLITPYGTTAFTKGETNSTRFLETLYPDGNRERVEFNETTSLGIPDSDPAQSVPTGMATLNQYLVYRNTYYWSKIACATAYGDYTKARIYHWLHADANYASGILESVKEPLEGRVWYDYAGQPSPNTVGTSDRPTHIGRVLDGGTTQLYTYEYNGFGHVTRTIDPLGRTFSYIYSTNGIDLLETRMTRAGANELLSRRTYNAQHLPLTTTDAAGQTNAYTYNSRGQVLTTTNPKNETIAYAYDTNGYLITIDGPLPGNSDSLSFAYDGYGRLRTATDFDGYTRTFDYDAWDRTTKITYPDATFREFTFDRLDATVGRDRGARTTANEYNSVREMTKETDPLNRVIQNQWCKCGDLRTLTDALGRTTTWQHDIQGRLTAKQFADGSKITYVYENTTSRLRQAIDEKRRITQYSYNRDGTINSIIYSNALIATPAVNYTYDSSYNRITSRTDGAGTTSFRYYQIGTSPSVGAGRLAEIDGPLTNEVVTCSYDSLGRAISSAINGVGQTITLDAIGRVTNQTNALGAFSYTYDGPNRRLLSVSYPNGQSTTYGYLDNLGDRQLQRITHTFGASTVSEFIYGYDIPVDRLTFWSQQFGSQPPTVYTFGYDAADQITSATVTNAAALIGTFAYTYDAAGNRLTEQIGSATNLAAYNALNELTTTATGSGTAITNEWDAEHRLTAVNAGSQRTEFTYDGEGHRVGIRDLVNGTEVANRRFVWCGAELCEERTPAGATTKRFFRDGVKVETGPGAGAYFYTRDHLGSVRELTDNLGVVRARYDYDPYGRRTRVAGDSDSDFGFTGYYYHAPTGLHLSRFREYDAGIGRWLSRDRLANAEGIEGPNLYCYAKNSPMNMTDPLGLKCDVCKKAEATPGILEGPDAHTDGGGVICYNGAKYPCFWAGQWAKIGITKKTPGYKQIKQCLIEHEITHIDQTQDCPKTGLSRPPPKNPQDVGAYERDAYGVGAHCLWDSIPECKGNADCIANLEREYKYACEQANPGMVCIAPITIKGNAGKH